MKFDFDLNNEVIAPILSLCNPNGQAIGLIGNYNELDMVLRYNALSELSFRAYESESSPYYAKLRPKRLIKVDTIGVFMITSIREVNDGVAECKEVVAESLEVELNYKSITLLEGTYKFFDAVDPKDTLMGKVMEYLPNWSIGTIDSDLWNLYRTFDLATQTLYGFLMGDIENAYGCVFEFDTLKRTISAKTPQNAVKKTDILLAYDNLIKETSIEENTDELITCLEVYGGSDLSVNLVNPLGSNKIFDFSYYKNLDWISQGLINKLDAWEAKIKANQELYATYLTQLKELNAQLVVLNSELTTLEGEWKNLEAVQKARIEQGLPYEDVWKDMQAKQTQIDAKKIEIAAKQNEVKAKQNSLSDINGALSFSNPANFTEEEYKELDHFIITQVYQNENFITTDKMTSEEVQTIAQNLYNQAQEVLEKVSQPRYTFSLSSVNFLFLTEYQPFTRQLELGSQILLELGVERYAYPILLELGLSFGDDRASLSMGFGNNLRLSNDDFRFSELFGDTVKTSNQVSFDSEKWKQYGKDKGAISEFINSALDASKNAVINADNQEILINENGLRGRRLDTETGNYDLEQLWMTSKNLVFSKDGFRTAEMAIGEIELPSGIKTYGIMAQAVVGKLLVSSELHIENEGGTFMVDANGVKLVNADIIITNEDGVEESLGSILDSSFLKVYETMEELKGAIQDGEIIIFYQETDPVLDPTNIVKEGDLWYNTADKNKAYIRKGSTWQSIQDQTVLDALEAANTAQNTADGKIRTFFQPEPPTMTPDKNVGDIWFDTNDGNRQYRWSGKSWQDVHDKTLDKISQDLANAITDLEKQINDVDAAIRDGIIDTFYQETEPSGSLGDLWFNTATGKLYRHNGATGGEVWELIEDSKIVDAIDKAQNAQDTADGKIRTFYQNDPPVSTNKYTLAEGDLWIDLNDGNKMYRWNNTSKAWISIRDLAIDEVSGNLADAITDINNKFANMEQAIADGVIETYYQDTMPTDGKIGDLWFNTGTGKLYRHNGKATNSMADWDGVEDAGIVDAIEKAQNAQDTADGKITSYYQDEPPTGTDKKPLGNGDLWFDTNDGNKPYRYDKTQKKWISIQDKSINALSKDLADAVTDINGRFDDMQKALEDGIIETFYQSTMPVGTVGDLWFKTDTGKLFRHNGGVSNTLADWDEITDKAIIDAIDKAQNAQDTADGKIRTFYQSEPPASNDTYTLANGDLWIDTNDKNRPYRWDTSAKRWVDIRDGSIADISNDLTQAITDINNKFEDVNQAIVDGILETFYQPTDPCLDTNKRPALGDLWFKTDTGKLYRHNGGSNTKRIKRLDAPYALKNITSIKQEEDIIIDVGGTYTLPTWVYATFSDSSRDWVNPSWNDTIDKNTAGTYTVYGVVSATSAYTNTNNVKAVVRVIVNGTTPSKNIKSIAAQNDVVIEKGGTYELPAWVLATLEDNTTSWVSATWDIGKINVNVAGTYAITGTITTTGEVTNTKNLKANIRVIVNNTAPTTKNIKSIANQTDVTINKGGTYMLPSTVNVTLDDNSTRSLSVAWNTGGINVNVPSTYSVVGTLTLVSGITNTSNLRANIRVVVIDNTPQDLTIISVNSLTDLTVPIGYPVNPPSRVTVKLSDNSTKNLAVTWDTSSVNNNKVGTYVCKGAIALVSGVANPSKLQASINVIVKDAINSVWDEITDKGIIEAIDKAQSAQDTADGKITSYYQATPPKNGDVINGKAIKLDNGDLWFNTAQKNEPHRYDKPKEAWISIRDGSIAEILDKLATTIADVNKKFEDMEQAIADGVIETFYQDAIPTKASLGDLWFDTANGKLYRHNGGANTSNLMLNWSIITDPDIIKAMEQAQKAEEVADGKITTYYLAVEPKDGMVVGGKAIKLAEGDLWINLGDKNKLHRYTITVSSQSYATWAMGSWDTLSRMTWSSLGMKTWDNIFGAGVGRWIPVRDGVIDDVENKVDSVLTPEGLLDTDKLHGQILAGKNNITCLNQAANKIVKINEAGIIIANSKTNGNWNWSTAISADGIDTKVLQGDIVASEKLIIKNKSNSFTVNENGVIITNGSFKMDTGDGKGRILLDPSEGIRIQTKRSGQNAFTDRLYVDMNGDMVFNGNLQAVGGTFTGTVNAGNIVGGTINGASIDGGYISVQTDVEVGRNLILKKDTGILQGVFFGQSNSLGMAHYRGDIILKADGAVNIDAPNGLTVNSQPLTSRATFG